MILNKTRFIQILSEAELMNELNLIKTRISKLNNALKFPQNDREGIFNINVNGDAVSFRKDILLSQLNQILEAQTLERAKYYLKRLREGVEKIKTNKINDINLFRWKEYSEIITDSLWLFKKRDSSGAHLGWYWGNFIPQIPRQLMWRYTKQGDWVLDPFAGSGTTLIECRRLGRNGIGVEINPEVVAKAKELIEKEPNRFNIVSEIVVGDSKHFDFKDYLKRKGIEKVQLIIMHPPYWDIIKFSTHPNDLSNAPTLERFLEDFGQVVDNVSKVLERKRYLAVVIGDKYSKGEWIPLGFYCLNEILKRGYKLKSIIVKNFEETRAKRHQKELWRYRALVGGFYVFKHEYILLFKKI